jgi:hypothetical protein
MTLKGTAQGDVQSTGSYFFGIFENRFENRDIIAL